MPTVHFEGDASGAIAAAAAAQGAIDAVHGKTVTVDVQFKQSGGGGAAGLADGFARAGAGAERAGRAARGMADDMQRAGVRVAGVASEAGRAAAGMRETADHAERMGRAVAAVAGGDGMRAIGAGAVGASRGMRELESGVSRAGVAIRDMSGTAGFSGMRRQIQGSIIDLQEMADGSFGVAAGMKAATAAGEKMRALGAGGPKPFSWAGVGADDFGYTGPRPQDRAGRTTAGRSPVADRLEAARAARAAGEGEEEAGKSASRASGHVMSLGRAFGLASMAGWELMSVGGAMAGVTTEAGKLMNSTTGMGLNFKGMAAGITEAEQSAARAHNIGLNGLDQELRQSARGMVDQLVPAMRAGVQATKAWEQAKMGAQASMGPNIEQFANALTRNAPALQQEMGAIGRAALNMGTDVVQALSSPEVQQAVGSLDKMIAGNSKNITDGAKAIAGVGIGLAQGAVGLVGAFGATDDAVQKMVRPGGVPGGWGQQAAVQGKIPIGGGRSFSFWDAGPKGGAMAQLFGTPKAGADAQAAQVAAGGFDPSKPYTGAIPDGSPTGRTYAGPAAPAREPFAGGVHTPPQYAGMSASQIYEQQYHAATRSSLAPQGFSSTGVGRPSEYGGFGSGVRPIPAGIGAALAGAGVSDTAGALVNHVQKAVHVASGAAQAGGSQLGAQMGGGIAQGIQTTQTVVDTVMVKHLKHVQDIAAGAGGIDAHSPSEKYRRLFRYVPEGMALGIRDGMYHPVAAMSDGLGQMQQAGPWSAQSAADQAYLDQARTPVTVSASRGMAARQYSDQVMDRIQAHNDRAQQLAQGRADRHEAALARAGVAGHSDPFANSNPFATAAQPNWWDNLNTRSPQQDLTNMFHKIGMDSVAGAVAGIQTGIPQVHAAGGQVATAGQNGYRWTDDQHSPSAVWAGMGANSVAGIPVGFTAGVPAAVSAMSDAAQQMSMALAGPLSDYGLKAGDTFAQSLIDGSSREIKAASYGALGEPGNLNPDAMANLAGTGLLRAGSGASALKTPSGGPSVVVLPQATPAPPQTIIVQVQHMEGDRMAGIADQRIELAFNEVTSTYDAL